MMKKLVCLLLALCVFCGVLVSCEDVGESFTVTFETNGGSTVNPISVAEGATVTQPTPPTREGYVFAGWYADEELLDAYVFGKMPAENITLYAKWTPADGEDAPPVGDDGENNSDNEGSANENDGNEDGGNEGGNEGGNTVIGGDRGDDGSWENVSFRGQTVKLAISVNQDADTLFPASGVFTKGPDSSTANALAREVTARNARASEELGINVEYVEKDLPYSEIQEDIRTIVQTSAVRTPDVYINDTYGLVRAMVDGLLLNLKDPEEGVKSYFDFEADGFYLAYMQGLTFDQEKMYLFAGDYFLDVIRMAWVLYVNNDQLAENLAKMPSWCESTNAFYEYVADGFWDIDELADIARRVHIDSVNAGATDKEDVLVGFAMNRMADKVFSGAGGVTLYYQDAADGYAPKVMDSVAFSDYSKASDKYTSMVNTLGVYYEEAVKSSIECFVQGNVLFAMSRLGEMESYVLRDCIVARGIVPVPKWDANVQGNYRTVVDDRAEIGCILSTAKAFSAASALMQYLGEESDATVNTYFEQDLKFKYNDDQRNRPMLDLVRDSTVSPFGTDIGVLCEDLYTGAGRLKSIHLGDYSTVSSTYAAEKDAYIYCMDSMIAKFAELD